MPRHTVIHYGPPTPDAQPGATRQLEQTDLVDNHTDLFSTCRIRLLTFIFFE